MFTIYDYLKYYKDYDINEVPWNNMDNVLLSVLVYIPIDSFRGMKSFSEMCNIIMNFKVPNKSEYLAPKIKSLIEIIINSKRYKNMKFINFENVIDNNTQFGAMVCKIGKHKIVVFKGTDRSIIGWIENFRAMYEYPTYTQSLAMKYLKNNIGLFDKDVYVIGHSKGGSMAMAAVMELKPFKFKKIGKVINFDGPGFMTKEFNSYKYERMSKKLINILPEGSFVGVLLNNKDYNFIQTTTKGISVHYPIFWKSFGTDFVSGTCSNISQELHNRSINAAETLDQESVREYFETAFSIFDKKKTDFVGFNIFDIIALFRKIRTLDKSISKYMNSIFKSMIKLSRNKE
jgi:hypothetical protein